jgi:single-strand DNA-binding protein
MINRVTLLGRLGAAPKLSKTNDGTRVANFRVCTTEVWQKDGEWNERPEWHQVAAFGDGISGVIEKHGQKGALVYLEGTLRTRSYEKDGQTHYSTEIRIERDGVIRFPERQAQAQAETQAAAAS